MNPGRLMILFLLILIAAVVDTVNTALGNQTFFDNSLWMLYGLAFVLLAVIIMSFVFRNQSQKKYLKHLEDDSDIPEHSLGDNQYFYRSPLYMVDNQPIKIYGQTRMKYMLYFNNSLQKWLSILGIFPVYRLTLESSDYKIQLSPVNPLLSRYRYNVYINNEKSGYFESKKVIKDKAAKKLLSYRFTDDKKEYDFNNDYLSFDAVISPHDSEENILKADRSFFDLKGEKGTKRCGEKHNIEIENHTDDFPHALWIALYA